MSRHNAAGVNAMIGAVSRGRVGPSSIRRRARRPGYSNRPARSGATTWGHHDVALGVSDVDHGYYADHSLTVARHPGETDERIVVRR